MLILGPSPQEQTLEYRIQRISSVEYTRTWIGPKAQLDTIAATEKLYAETVALTANGAICTLTCRYINGTDPEGDGEVPEETQEIDTAQVQQSIFHNKTFQALTSASQFLVRKTFENNEKRADALTVFSIAVAAAEMTSTEQALAIKAFDLLSMGTDSFENYGYVLTRTRKASRRYTGAIDLTRINKLWTTADVATYVANPLLFAVPDLTCTTEETAKGLLPRWRMSVCSVTDSSDGSRVMREQWQLAKWSSDLYETYTLP